MPLFLKDENNSVIDIFQGIVTNISVNIEYYLAKYLWN